MNQALQHRGACALLALLLCLGLLAGCGSRASSSIIMAAPPQSSSAVPPEAKPEAEAEPAAEEEVADKPIALSTATRNLSAGYAGDDDYCFGVLSHADGSADVMHFDYGAMQLALLADIPKADESLQGRIPNVYGNATPVLAGGHLFLFKQRATPALVEEQGQNAHAGVLRLSPDGGAPQVCPLGPNISLQFSSAALWDGENLIFMAIDYTGNSARYVLMQLNAERMQATELHRFEEGYEYAVEGYWGMGPVISAASALPPNDDPAFNESWNNRAFTLYRLGLTSGELTELYAWVQGQPNNMQDATFYYFVKEENRLYAMDADSGESRVLAEGFAPGDYVSAQMQNMQGGQIRIQFTADQGYTVNLFVIDPESGALSQPPVDRLGDSIAVLAERDAYFLVRNGERWVNKERVNPAFEASSAASYNDRFVSVPEYGLISKADYWAGNANFLAIEDTIYP